MSHVGRCGSSHVGSPWVQPIASSRNGSDAGGGTACWQNGMERPKVQNGVERHGGRRCTMKSTNSPPPFCRMGWRDRKDAKDGEHSQNGLTSECVEKPTFHVLPPKMRVALRAATILASLQSMTVEMPHSVRAKMPKISLFSILALACTINLFFIPLCFPSRYTHRVCLSTASPINSRPALPCEVGIHENSFQSGMSPAGKSVTLFS